MSLQSSRVPFWRLALLLAAFTAGTAHGQVVVFSDDFNTNTSANYNVFQTKTSGGGDTSDATWAYDYGAAPGSGGLSIPVAPNTTDSTTLGLRLRVGSLGNTSGAAVGAITVVTNSLSLSAPYSVKADVWGNYIGGTSIASGGTNSTTGAAIGIGTSGTGLQSPNGNDGMLADALRDGGSTSTTYRVYTNNTNQPDGPMFTAGTRNRTNAFYTSAFPPNTAPAGQSAFAPATQGGSTVAGIIGFSWHTFELLNDGTNVFWYLDSTLIATVPVSAFTTGGQQISLNAIDINTGGNTAGNAPLFNADIWDNLVVTAIPEPGSMTLLGVAGAGLLFRRWRRKA